MDAGIAPWESSQAAPKLDLGTPYPLNYSPRSSSCNLLEACTAGLTLMDGDSLDLLCLEVWKRKFQVGMVLRAAPCRTVELQVPAASQTSGSWQHSPDNSRAQEDLWRIGKSLSMSKK